MHPQPRPFTFQLFLDFCAIFFPEWPLNFFVIAIHQVMWPSPGILPHRVHPKTLIEMWIICLDQVSANSEKGSGSEWAVRVGQRVPSRFGQSGAAREMNLVQIVTA